MSLHDVKDLYEPGIVEELMFCSQARLEVLFIQLWDDINGNGTYKPNYDRLWELLEVARSRCTHRWKPNGTLHQQECSVCLLRRDT